MPISHRLKKNIVTCVRFYVMIGDLIQQIWNIINAVIFLMVKTGSLLYLENGDRDLMVNLSVIT